MKRTKITLAYTPFPMWTCPLTFAHTINIHLCAPQSPNPSIRKKKNPTDSGVFVEFGMLYRSRNMLFGIQNLTNAFVQKD
jgi:hypothetical protein